MPARPAEKLTDLPNIGPKIAGRLNEIGVFSAADLRRMGAARAHALLKQRHSQETLPVCYYLYSFEGALTNQHWNAIGEVRKKSLKAASNKFFAALG
jgi:DNA transformation protein and related proteins